MRRDTESHGAVEKERLRAEIDNQVEQFLQKGGHIDVLNDGSSREVRQFGSVWQNLSEEIGLSS